MSIEEKHDDSIGAELADVRRQNADLLSANIRFEQRARDAEASQADMSKALFASSLFCGYVKGEPIQKTGGDYDADARFVCAFEFEGVVGFVGAIPQKRGHLFVIFNPKQITAGTAPAIMSEIKPRPADHPVVEAVRRRFLYRKGWSILVLIGEAILYLYSEVSEGDELIVYHLNGKLRATTSYLTPIEGAIFLGVAKLQTAEPLGPGVHQLTFYRGEADNRLWLRPTAEFHDGRFEELLLDPGVETAKGDDGNGR